MRFLLPLRPGSAATYNGDGDPIDCPDCDAPYCYRHWHVSEPGYGSYPRGHGKSLDPHW
jgi:hypothetical protein